MNREQECANRGLMKRRYNIRRGIGFELAGEARADDVALKDPANGGDVHRIGGRKEAFANDPGESYQVVRCALENFKSGGIALSRGFAYHARETGTAQGLAQGRAQAAVITQMAVAPALNGRTLSVGLTDKERLRLQNATDLAVFRGSITAIRLRDFAGDVVFSDNGSTTDP